MMSVSCVRVSVRADADRWLMLVLCCGLVVMVVLWIGVLGLGCSLGVLSVTMGWV